MITVTFISPLLLVVFGVLLVRRRVCKRPFAWLGWTCSTFLIVGACLLPLTQGVWILDLAGLPRRLADATGLDGSRFEVVQYWNYVDFYTTEVRTTTPDGNMSVKVLDRDAKRTREAAITLDESDRMVMLELDGKAAYSWCEMALAVKMVSQSLIQSEQVVGMRANHSSGGQ